MPSVMEFDHVMEEHKQRKLADVAEADRQRILAERGRDEATQQLVALQGELVTTQRELETFKHDLAQRKQDWDDSVKRIQQVLEDREAVLVVQEAESVARLKGVEDSEGRCRHQWTILLEVVDTLKTSLSKYAGLSHDAQTAFLAALPSGTDVSA